MSDGVRQFVESGQTSVLELEAANRTFLDSVLAPPISQGVGVANTTIFVDSNHTKVTNHNLVISQEFQSAV